MDKLLIFVSQWSYANDWFPIDFHRGALFGKMIAVKSVEVSTAVAQLRKDCVAAANTVGKVPSDDLLDIVVIESDGLEYSIRALCYAVN